MFVGLFCNLLSTDAHCLIIILSVHDIVDFVQGSVARSISVRRYTCNKLTVRQVRQALCSPLVERRVQQTVYLYTGFHVLASVTVRLWL